MRKILITGGAGFIGSALVRYIINETSDAVKSDVAGTGRAKRALCL